MLFRFLLSTKSTASQPSQALLYRASRVNLRPQQSLLTSGAREMAIPQYCQNILLSIPTHNPPEDRRGKIGAQIFLSIWLPIMAALESLVSSATQEDGQVPLLIAILVRTVVKVMWVVHDAIFAPLFGRGDGRDGKTNADNKTSEKNLLEENQC